MSAVMADNLAGCINAEHEASQAAAESAVEHAAKCGELLIQAKSRVAHGEWAAWIADNCPNIADRTTRAYMRLHREMQKLEPAKRQRVADLSIRDAMRAVAANTGALRKVPAEKLPAVESRWAEKGGSVYGIARGEVENAKRDAVNQERATAIVQKMESRGAVRLDDDPDRAVILEHTRENQWRVHIGPNSVGRQYDSWTWMAMARSARDVPELAEIAKELDAANQALAVARSRVFDLERKIEGAAYDHLERTIGTRKENEYHFVAVPTDVTNALLNLPDDERSGWAEAVLNRDFGLILSAEAAA